MKVSFFETGRYSLPPGMPRGWPVASGAYDPELGAKSYCGMVERARFVERLGFDWISLSEHHYSPRILTPSPPLAAAYLASRVDRIRFALLGPIVPVSNPVRVAEELAMLDTMAPGRFVFGLLRGTTNEYLSYDLNPKEARERTDEGMELILRAWTEPQPFSWQGRYFQYRTVSIWPRPPQQPRPGTYALGVSAEAADFAARHRLGLGVSYGTFALMAKSTGYYRQRCAEYGWEPGPDDIIYRANMILAATDEAAEAALARRSAQAPFPIAPALRESLIEQDKRNVGGEKRAANVGGVLPISFCGGPDRIVEQVRRAREEIGAGVLDLSLADPGSGDTDAMMSDLELFGKKVLPRIREI
jgi:alkanesulfonate monooxygenase SsuD/methylene tetrahydromethanopterin reductase-like flavin-dependent oxidoreductase (luciferase family)